MTVQRANWFDNRIPPPVVGIVVAAAMWALSATGPVLAVSTGARSALVALLVAAGVAVDVLGIVGFRKSRTTVNPLRPERASALVTRGIYRVTRNPMYVGMALLLLAWAVQLSALLPLAGVAAFIAYITRFQIVPEERALRQRFGSEYDDYCARVRRWV